jgi:hypothetical protein
MKVLLSDASGLTSRQIATILSRQGHIVHVLSPSEIALTKYTSHVARVHRVPPFGNDPYAWLDRALETIINEKSKAGGFDVLICTQEQVAIVSAEIDRVKETGIHVAVPEFGSLRKVIDKVSACNTLREVGLSQPESVILSSALDLHEKIDGYEAFFPAYAKLPIATGSTGVRRVPSVRELKDLCRRWRPFDSGRKLLLQKEVKGPLLMICGIFSHGKLLAWHSCLRAREGVSGGASKKVSLRLPIVEREVGKLGKGLGWHGGLSMDAILLDKGGGEKELMFIDINPRIVEPMNGLLAGVDLVDALVQVSFERDDFEIEQEKEGRKIGVEGVQTHQLILSLLAAAKEGRVSLAKELWMALRGWDGYYGYKGSVEELTPLEGDWWSLLLLVVFTILLFVGGKWMVERFSGGSVKNYAVSPEGWDEICRREDEKYHPKT